MYNFIIQWNSTSYEQTDQALLRLPEVLINKIISWELVQCPSGLIYDRNVAQLRLELNSTPAEAKEIAAVLTPNPDCAFMNWPDCFD